MAQFVQSEDTLKVIADSETDRKRYLSISLFPLGLIVFLLLLISMIFSAMIKPTKIDEVDSIILLFIGIFFISDLVSEFYARIKHICGTVQRLLNIFVSIILIFPILSWIYLIWRIVKASFSHQLIWFQTTPDMTALMVGATGVIFTDLFHAYLGLRWHMERSPLWINWKSQTASVYTLVCLSASVFNFALKDIDDVFIENSYGYGWYIYLQVRCLGRLHVLSEPTRQQAEAVARQLKGYLGLIEAPENSVGVPSPPRS